MPTPAMQDRALDAAMTYVAERGVTSRASHGNVGGPRRIRAGAQCRQAPHAHLRRRCRCPPGRDCATRSLREAAVTRGFASAGSRGSSTDRSARTPPRCSSRSPTRRATRGLLVNTPDDLYTLDLRRRQGGAARDRPRDRRSRDSISSSTSSRRVERENGARDRRFRIEHAQHIAPRDIPRFAAARRDREHAAVPRDRRRTVGREGDRTRAGERRRTPSGRCSIRARGSRSAATGSSRRRRRSRGSTPRSRVARSTTAPRRLGARAEDRGGAGAARLHQRCGDAGLSKKATGRARAGHARRPRDSRSRPHARSRRKPFASAKVVLTIVGGRVVYDRGTKP